MHALGKAGVAGGWRGQGNRFGHGMRKVHARVAHAGLEGGEGCGKGWQRGWVDKKCFNP